ncbi:hypothetical protein [Streptomyces sp. NPDC001450]
MSIATWTWTWTVRRDVAPPVGLKPLASYKAELYAGQVEGAVPADPDSTLGRTPGAF